MIGDHECQQSSNFQEHSAPDKQRRLRTSLDRSLSADDFLETTSAAQQVVSNARDL